MKLEPVYLLGPKPKPPSIPSRRAFLIAGGTFLAGVGLGGACGYAAGVRGEGEPNDEQLKSTGDATLDELRRLAVKAPIDELMEKHMVFLHHLSSVYQTDTVLWGGAKRICDELLSNPRIKSRRRVAGWLAHVIDSSDPKIAGTLRTHIVELKRLK